jgi:D-3-phosphoglycerate dehydrogenase
VSAAGIGLDNVDVEAATRRGIVVANAPESTVISAAEHTIGLLLALSRHIPQAHAALKEGRWERSRYGGLELAGKTLGVLGFGRIGQQVARRALGLEMHVVAYDPFVARERFRELGVERLETQDDGSHGRLPDAAPAADHRDAGRSKRRSRRCATASGGNAPAA